MRTCCLPHRQRQAGATLFLILIAVALFAGLSFAITQSSRSSGSISKEAATLGAARIVQYASAIESATNRLMMGNNRPAEDIRFNNSVGRRLSGALLNTAIGTPADPTLYVFHPQGGGVSPQLFTDLALCTGAATDCAVTATAPLPGHFAFRWSNTGPGVGTDVADMVLGVYYLRREVCEAINRGLGISGTPVITISNNQSIASAPPNLAYASGAAPALAAIAGKSSFCISHNDGNYSYYHFLVVN